MSGHPISTDRRSVEGPGPLRYVLRVRTAPIVLRGRVSSFYHKQPTQEVVRNATGGGEVINAIRVVYLSDRRDTTLERAG